MMVIENGGFHDDKIGRQIGVCGNPNSGEIMPYLQTKTGVSESKKHSL